MDKEKDKIIQNEDRANEKNPVRLSVEELDEYSGGTIGNAKVEQQKPIDE